MALRYRINEVREVRPGADLSVPAKVRPPQTIEFRRGADLIAVAREVMAHQSVLLDAAVGSGKSTLFPQALASVTKALVIHVTPNPLLAVELYEFVNKMRESKGEAGVPLELFGSVADKIPKTGVWFMGAADLVAWLLNHKGHHKLLRDVTVVLDEAHESDAFTHTLRSLVIQLGFSRLVLMSATLTPGDSRSRETPGKLEVRKFDASESPGEWRVDDRGKPWHFGNITNNLLVFIDSRSQAAHLKREYQTYGLLVYRLEANMAQADYMQAMRALRDRKGPLVVLLADYSFRSGFTFDVDLVIDTGSVSYYDPTPGQVRRMCRPMFKSESVQAAGRAGRIRSGVVVYYHPDVELRNVICDLEEVEKEAAAYLSRCLGFFPAAPLHDAVMAKAELPQLVSLSSALNGLYPLTCHVLKTDGSSRCPTPELVSDRETVSSASSGSERLAPPKYSEVEGGARRDSGTTHQEMTEATVKFMSGLKGAALAPVHVGGYYTIAGVTGVQLPELPAHFPRGLKSVLKCYETSLPSVRKVAAMDPVHRKVALKYLLRRYNELNVEIAAFVGAANKVSSETENLKLARAAKDEIARVLEKVNGYEVDRVELLPIIVALVSDDMDIREVSPPDAMIQDRIVLHYDAMKALLCEATHGCMSDDMSRFSEIDYGGKDRKASRERESEELMSLQVPGWMGYKKLEFTREREFDRYGNLRGEWKRVKMSTSSWKRRLTGVDTVIEDFD